MKMKFLRPIKSNVSTTGFACALTLLYVSFSVSLSAQMLTPLQVTVGHSIINEFGQVIHGDATVPPEERPLVQLLWASGGVVQPPEETGHPAAVNPPVDNGTSAIGNLVSPTLVGAGIFAAAVANPRPNSGQVFVRVYNAPTIEESLFYADSQMFTLSSANDPLIANFGPVTNIISATRDTDGDGLPDYWEHLNFGYATAANAHEDLDGDGMTVLQEFIAGTDPNNPSSRFAILSVAPVFEDEPSQMYVVYGDGGEIEIPIHDVVGHELEWPSIADRLYTVEYSTNLLTGFSVLPGAVDLPATPDRNVFTNTEVPEAGGPVYYRIRVRLAE